MIKVESSAVINRSVEDVWDFVTDCTNEPQWHIDCLTSELTSPQPLRPGSTQAWSMAYAKGQVAQLRVTELEPHHREQLETVSAPMNIKPLLTYTFESEGTTTRFTRAMEVRLAGATRAMEPFLRRMMKKNNASYVCRLKEVLEAAAPRS